MFFFFFVFWRILYFFCLWNYFEWDSNEIFFADETHMYVFSDVINNVVWEDVEIQFEICIREISWSEILQCFCRALIEIQRPNEGIVGHFTAFERRQIANFFWQDFNLIEMEMQHFKFLQFSYRFGDYLDFIMIWMCFFFFCVFLW